MGWGNGIEEEEVVGGHERSHLSQKPVDEHGPDLPEAVDAEDALDVIGRVPGGVEDDDPVGSHQVDAQRACSGRDEEEATPREDDRGGGGEERIVLILLDSNFDPATSGPLHQLVLLENAAF